MRTISPVDGCVYVTRPFATDDDIASAVMMARNAQRRWRVLPLDERVELVRNAVNRLVAAKDELSLALTWQMGRPISHAPGEFCGVLLRSDYMLDIAAEALSPLPGASRYAMHLEIWREPLGVIAVITPWNYPYLTAVNTIVPALAAGNVVIHKPSPQTPLTGEHFADAFAAAGLPDGVFQCLHLSPAQTLNVVGNSDIDHVAFTGSVATGALVEKAAAGRFLGVGLELGGKDPAYVREDADIEVAAASLTEGAYFNAGQSCCAVERIYVHRERYADFLAAFVEKSRQYVLGDPLHDDTTLGPVVNRAAADRIRRDIEDALERGAEALIEDELFPKADVNTPYLAPQVLVDVNHDMRIMREEAFGPVVGIMPVTDDAEALRLMNDSVFGLSASLWTQDEQMARTLSKDIKAGTVFLNRCDYLEPSLAWSGMKHSGRGCSLSRFGYDALTRAKSLHFRHCVG